jgi:hypothetical protein
VNFIPYGKSSERTDTMHTTIAVIPEKEEHKHQKERLATVVNKVEDIEYVLPKLKFISIRINPDSIILESIPEGNIFLENCKKVFSQKGNMEFKSSRGAHTTIGRFI